MTETKNTRFQILFSALFLLGFSGVTQAALVFVNESDGTHDPVFYIDSGDASTDFIDLEFGNSLDAKLRFDVVNDKFNINRATDFSGNEIQNVKFESAAAEPAACDATQLGRVYFNTAEEATYICNGSNWEVIENNAGPYSADLKAALYSESLSTNVNAAATNNLVPWNVEVFEDNYFVHDTVVNNSRIQVTQSGRYLVSGAISAAGTSTRWNGSVKFRINGVTDFPARFQPGYVRNTGGQNETSLVYSVILDLSANDYFEVLVDRESGNGNAITMGANESNLSVVLLKVPVEQLAPFIDGDVIDVQTLSTGTVSITGRGFTPDSVVTLPGFPGTINSTTVVSPTQIDLNLTTTATEATYDIVIENNGVANTVWAGNGVNGLNVELIAGTGVAGTYIESFETGLGSWADSGLDVAWTRDSGGTPSGGTGPTVASVGTFYMFTEASNPNFPDVTFGLQTTDFRVAQSVSFDYHMFGAAMGDLELQTLRSGVWTTRSTISGQQQAAQGDAYLNQFVDLSSFPVEGIRFVYTSGTNFTGDCTIDNVIIIST